MLAAQNGLEMARKIWPEELEKDRKALVERRSALRWPERISAPVLIMHGGADRSCPPEQSLKMAEALQAAGKPYELKSSTGRVTSSPAGRRSETRMRSAGSSAFPDSGAPSGAHGVPEHSDS